MPSIRFPVRSIETLMPSVDPRASNKTHLIDGRNFLWEAKGPKSGFGSKQLTPFPIAKPRDVHAVRAQGLSFVYTQDAILAWRGSVPYMWDLLYTFSTEVPEAVRTPWQVIYLNGSLYMSQGFRGFFSANVELNVEIQLRPQTSTTIPGLPDGIKGMTVVRGRAILVNDFTITWSNTGDLTDLTPALGGAGFQVIAGITKGTYIALTQFQDGFVVWTTEGAVLAQFIGGDEVWRFDPLISKERPISAWATVELTTGATAFLSQHGLFTSGAGDNPEAWTPQFNEFFREYVKNIKPNSIFFRLEYDETGQYVYLLESADKRVFHRTFVLSPTLDKWGMFSERAYGILPLSDDLYGYVGVDGLVHYFTGEFAREMTPPNERGLDRHYPLLQKRLASPSSTAVSRAVTYDPTYPFGLSVIPRAGWYNYKSFTPAIASLGGMDSWIEIGYLRPDDLSMAADAYAEYQEINIGGLAVSAPYPVDFTTQWNEDKFYPEIEDWDSPGTITYADIHEDLMLLSGSEDLISSQGANEDYLYRSTATTVFDDVVVEDWDSMPDSVEDWGGQFSGLPALTYKMTIRASQDGITFEEYVPEMSKFNTATSEFTTFTSGTYHAIRIEANVYGEYFYIMAIDLTALYGGQQA